MGNNFGRIDAKKHRCEVFNVEKINNLSILYGTATFPPVFSQIMDVKSDTLPSLKHIAKTILRGCKGQKICHNSHIYHHNYNGEFMKKIFGFTRLENVAHVDTSNKKRKAAFTLAEVLITLGIIGVVAALTMPSLIAKFQHKALESQFKKSVSVVSQVILKTKTDMGLDNLYSYCTAYSSADDHYYNDAECYKYMYKNLLVIESPYAATPVNPQDAISKSNIKREEGSIRTYNGKQTVTSDALAASGYPIFSTNLMPDGSFVDIQIRERNFIVGVDVNGEKGPNKLGHDVFLFTLSNKDFLTYFGKPDNSVTDEKVEEDIANGSYPQGWQAERAGNPCNLESTRKANGVGCTYYALRNQCPYDSSKSYFECLP